MLLACETDESPRGRARGTLLERNGVVSLTDSSCPLSSRASPVGKGGETKIIPITGEDEGGWRGDDEAEAAGAYIRVLG